MRFGSGKLNCLSGMDVFYYHYMIFYWPNAVLSVKLTYMCKGVLISIIPPHSGEILLSHAKKSRDTDIP